MSEPFPSGGPPSGPSGLPYPSVPPTGRGDLPEQGAPGAPAAWGLRGLARILDLLIVSFLFGLLTSALGTGIDDRTQELTGPRWPLLLMPVFFILYETVALARCGQTLGKWACQIKAVRWSDGDLATTSQTFVRAALPGVFALAAAAAPIVELDALAYLQFVPVVIYLWSLTDPLYRGPHDKAAGTIVLAAPRVRPR